MSRWWLDAITAVPMAQPATTLTDYAIALQALISCLSLLRLGWQHQQLPVLLWAGAFASVCGAASLGGTLHGFGWQLPLPVALSLWQGLLLVLGLASGLMLAGGGMAALPRRWWGAIALLAMIKLGLYCRWLAADPRYGWAVIDYLGTMLVLLALYTLALQSLLGSRRWLLLGVLLSAIAAAVEALGLTPVPTLSYDAVYHVIQMGALGCFERSVRLLIPRYTTLRQGS